MASLLSMPENPSLPSAKPAESAPAEGAPAPTGGRRRRLMAPPEPNPEALMERVIETPVERPAEPAPERAERPERGDRPERPERGDRGDRQDRGDRGNRGDRGDRGGQDRGGQDRPGHRMRPAGGGNDDFGGGGRGSRRDRRRGGNRGAHESMPYDIEGEIDESLVGHGILELSSDGYGFLRRPNLIPSNEDVYVAQAQIKRFHLKSGDHVVGPVRAPKDNEKYQGLLRVDTVNGINPEVARLRPHFDELTPIYPNERLVLETDAKNVPMRFIDLIAPIGKGQRGIIVAPPKAGKTILLKQIANSLAANHPDIHLIVLLIDERPEEVTDMRRSVKGDVIASPFDELPENHMRMADLTMEKAKRQVEMGKDVVILLDSITRLSRASNLTVTPSGRTLQGGLDPAAIYRPKRFFGAARNIENGGSLTIVATALVETGSRMDDIIFEEFKGTGNMELKLDRSLSEQRIYPAIDIKASGTRHDELLYPEEDLRKIWQLHRVLAGLGTKESTELLIDRIEKTRSNRDFLSMVGSSKAAD